ncbi:hypothetical protein OG21DRAFT_1602549 [Imleria badia]|nr:hypothetical protein OG21DRAFT_1602549 [Imleria badia]
MGLFKRLFSIGSKRSKKRSTVDPCTESLPPLQQHLKPSHGDDTEAAVSRLLRSSSGRCAAEPQIGLGSLPPLPHPIDSVIPPPKSSSTTLASVSARSTYSVTIRSRTVHSRTVFPNAYPDVSFSPRRSLTDSPRRRSKSVPITPRDKNRLQALRQDPSVASLLNHYDDQGHLNSALFSNTPSPQKEGGVQRRRTGSTLRQLLGHPSSPDLMNGSVEGDISWAEKFLGETDGNSSVSSFGPRTPADTHFTHTLSTDDKTALSIECDTSSANHPTFSSLEVELSVSTDLAHPQALNSPYGNSMSPQRASQVFGFLGDKKRAHDGPVSRLPQLKTTPSHYRRFSAESSISDTKLSHIPLPRRCNTHIPQHTSSTSQLHYSLASDVNSSPPSPTAAVFLSPQLKDEESTLLEFIDTQQSSRGPRGPRPPSRIPSRQSTDPLSAPCDSYPMTEQPLPAQSVLGEKSSADRKYISVAAPRPREIHSQIPKLRTASGSSSSSAESPHDPSINSPSRHPVPWQPTAQMKLRPIETELATGIAPHSRENDALSRLPQPVTPIRPFSLHSHHLREPPSPTTSSELSPVAKQMMANLRQDRMHARQRERQAGRLGSSQSRIRY